MSDVLPPVREAARLGPCTAPYGGGRRSVGVRVEAMSADERSLGRLPGTEDAWRSLRELVGALLVAVQPTSGRKRPPREGGAS
jgi:hypothetical protein